MSTSIGGDAIQRYSHFAFLKRQGEPILQCYVDHVPVTIKESLSISKKHIRHIEKRRSLELDCR